MSLPLTTTAEQLYGEICGCITSQGSYVAAVISFACKSHVCLLFYTFVARRRCRATRVCIALLACGIAHLHMCSLESKSGPAKTGPAGLLATAM